MPLFTDFIFIFLFSFFFFHFYFFFFSSLNCLFVSFEPFLLSFFPSYLSLSSSFSPIPPPPPTTILSTPAQQQHGAKMSDGKSPENSTVPKRPMHHRRNFTGTFFLFSLLATLITRFSPRGGENGDHELRRTMKRTRPSWLQYIRTITHTYILYLSIPSFSTGLTTKELDAEKAKWPKETVDLWAKLSKKEANGKQQLLLIMFVLCLLSISGWVSFQH